MTNQADPRWLDTSAAARYLSITEAHFRRLVADGTLPGANYTLGKRTPRWRADSLDATMEPSAASTDIRTSVQAIANQIEAEGRARREAQAGRRDG